MLEKVKIVAVPSCSYWDTAYDADVMDNRVGLNLLYTQVRGPRRLE